MRHTTEGSEAVRRHAEKVSQKEIAERVSALLGRKISQSLISRCASGQTLPTGDVVAALHVLRIARASQWLKRVHTCA